MKPRSSHCKLDRPHPYPGKLIVVEGIDGSGKSTQVQLAQRWLAAAGYQVFLTEWNSADLVRAVTPTSPTDSCTTSCRRSRRG